MALRLVKGWLGIVLTLFAALGSSLAVGADVPKNSRSVPAGVARSPKDPRALAALIDAALAAQWAEAKISPVAMAEDGEFLRRACLDIVGKIPTAAEARDFLDDPSKHKRITLIERLLESPAYTTRTTELWRKLLLPEADTDDQARAFAGTFEAWLRRKVVEEAGYDRIAREILTAKLAVPNPNGNAVAAQLEPSPAAYYLAKENKPENLAGGVARVFLGVRLECAQCHNHPFADWKREQFWSFAAFFAEIARPDPENPNAVVPRSRDAKPIRELTIPGTKKTVSATHLDGTSPAWRPRADTREILAEWVTSRDNHYFGRAVVNRLWARFYGVGLIEPVDDIAEEKGSEFDGLLDELAYQFQAHDYNLKYLIRAMTMAQAYGLASTANPAASASPLFSSMPVRGLSAGQLFDSLTQATGSDGNEARGRFLELFANRESRAVEAETTIVQALTMMNGSYIDSATNPATGQILGAVVMAPFLDLPSRIESLYLASLTRRPRPEELAMLVRYVERRKSPEDQEKALADIFWAILNGPEFPLNH